MTTPLDPDRIAALLGAVPRILRAELEAAGEPLASWAPGPAEWSMKSCVGHLIEAERRGFAGRIRVILGADRPALEGWDPPAVAAARRDDERDTAGLLDELDALRAHSVALVVSLRPADLDRSGHHPEVGELFVRDLLGEWIHHDRNHVRQALAIAQARVLGQLGNAVRFLGE